MSKKVYQGRCPNQSFFEIELEGDCRNCEYYERCIKRERARRKKAAHLRDRIFAWCAIIASVMFIILIGVFLIDKVVTAIFGNSAAAETMTSTSNVPTITEPAAGSSAIQVEIDIYVQPEISAQDKPKTVQEVINSGYTTVETKPEPYIVATISAYGPGEVYYYNLSYEDKVYIAKAVYKEARGEPFEGQVAVAATVLNRYVSNDRRFDRDSIYTVVTQSGQYANISSVTMTDLNSVSSCMEAVEAACKGWDPTRVLFEEGAKFFFNPDGDMSDSARAEREGVETLRIGNHLFHNDFNN